MTAELKNGVLTITLPVNKAPFPDCKPNKQTNKVENVLVASTHGYQDSTVAINGGSVRINVVAIMKK